MYMKTTSTPWPVIYGAIFKFLIFTRSSPQIGIDEWLCDDDVVGCIGFKV